ncbi:MAG TPA: ABC transporter substrate-binding protein [Burkholderiales bacterium]|nr:ABC transporter substrate-binding protein [Burkholderiales bacterium]
MGSDSSRTAWRTTCVVLVVILAIQTPAFARIDKLGKPEGAVDILAWPSYIERGETDKAFDWVTEFETKTGCKVNVKTATNSDEMLAAMSDGSFDLVVASGDASLRLIAGALVQEINTALIPSYTTIDPRLQKAPWHYVNGKNFGVPYQWGATVLAYNSSVFKTPPKSWDVVFTAMQLPDGKPNQGRVEAFDGPMSIADAALYLMTTKPDLAIKDPYALDEKQYLAVLELMREQRKLVGRYWRDARAQIEDFRTASAVAGSSWAFQVNFLRAEGRPIASVVPREGSTGWSDTTMMHVSAKHPTCAYLWLEHTLDPKVQGDLAARFGSVPVVPSACKGNKLLGDKGCETNGMNEFDRLWFWRTPVADCGGGRACVPYPRWAADFAAVVAGR